MATSIIYNKQQILEMIKNKNPAVSFVKPKHAKSLKWDNYLQVFINNHAQHFISCLKCHCILAWKPNDGTNVMDKHNKACRQQQFSSSSQSSIDLFYPKNINVSKTLINSTKRKIIHSLAECCALDSLPFTLIRGGGFKELIEVLIKTGHQLGSAISIDDLIPNSTTISREIDKIYTLRKEQLISYLATINNFVITVDFWTEQKTKVHYGGVTLHTYSEQHGLLVFVLACKPYDLATQSADNIRLFTESILKSYGLTLDRVKYVVSDNKNKMRASFSWCSAYDMISSFIDVYPDLNGVISDKSRKSILAGIDFDETLAFAKYLKYFVDVTELLSAEKTPTMHLVLPFKQRLINLSKPDTNDPNSIIKLKKYIENQIPTYWELDDIHYMAAVLHPKMKHLQICSNKDKKKAYDLLKKEINKRHENTCFYISAHQINAPVGSATSLQPTLTTSPDSNDFLSECFDQISTAAIAPNTNDELKRYLQSNDNLIHDDEDLLIFWKRQKVFYPTMYSIACEILIVPATNTAAERLFSASGKTITNTRTRLATEKVDKLMFIKKNLLTLKEIFVKNGKLHDAHTQDNYDATGKKGEKRSYEDDSDDDNENDNGDDDNDDDNDIIFTDGETV
ncbi:unnamed protein product [Rotaria sp. Silwood2]|nr:unnamed protein product [Rotaria sp. Silwood2]